MEIRIYKNKKMSNKYIEVHNDGHYHNSVRQIILAENGVRTYPGASLHQKKNTLYRRRKWELDELLESYEECEGGYIYATCSCCGRTEGYLLLGDEAENYKKYKCYGRQLGMIQYLFPHVPNWIRSGAIDQYSGGFCTCPKCW